MEIQWFPGHMAKTRRKLVDQLCWVDAVLEVADARIPVSSRNPLLRDLVGDKPRIILLNKADLADEGMTDCWRHELARENREGMVLAVSAATGLGMKKIVPQLELLLAKKMKALADKGVRPRPCRVMVVGIPNIGKSSLINRLTAAARAKTGGKPGVTRDSQWVRVHDRVDLLDTPGMLWPKFDDPEAGLRLAATGAVRDEVYDLEELAQWLLDWLKAEYPRDVGRYGAVESPEEVTLEALGRRRGHLVGDGAVDCYKTAQMVLKDFRAGRIGRITLDRR
ncbi:MAG: ribosome biogenesis GTPase YlqF [Peptococcaceae bacterium]|nr:ribosome biogenesis GTPase YlqF [Peptococcaceae bacterium]